MIMRLNMLCHNLDHWVYHWIRFSRCYWVQIVWSIMFFLSISPNLLVLVHKNWREWRIEDQERQDFGFSTFLG